MNLTLRDTHLLGTLPQDVRREAEQWRDALLSVSKPIERSLARIAAAMGCSVGTARRKYDDFRKNNFSISVLINRAKLPERESALHPDFIAWIKAKAEKNQRKTRPAWRAFCREWSSGAEIPGLDNSLPRYCLPSGCGYDNVQRKIRDSFATTAMRQGLGAAIAKCGPQIFSNRAALWYGSHLMIDDVWHDNFVVFRNQIVRVLELDALDVFSGCLVGHGTKPRFRREDGTMDGLKEKYARLLVANVFFQEGYSLRGSTIMAEHGTAAVSERVAKLLHDRTGGLIRLRESGITEQEQAICGWRGRGKGNPRFKAALESLRNLKHNELASLPGQTGYDRNDRPEFLHGQLQECEDMLKAMTVLAVKHPQRARQLRLNLLDYHADFLPLLMDVYREINARTWHQLQGWHEAGNIVIEYRTAPSAERWLTNDEFSLLPAISQNLLIEAAKTDPSYIQTRKLSPAEVRERHRHGLQRLPAFVVGEILGEDCARELKVKGAYFNEFTDQELCPEPLRYESVIVTPEGKRLQLTDGTYLAFVNPFDLEQLFVHDARQKCLGIAPRVQRIDPSDTKALERAYGYRAHRIAELKAPILARHAATVREETARLEHNARVLDTSKPFTEQEKEEAAFTREHGAAAAEGILAPPQPEQAEPSEGDSLLDAISK